MTTWIFAGVKQRDRLPPELLSRFVTFDFKPYIREEFLEVAEAFITGQLGKDPDLAHCVAERVLCDSPEEVDKFEDGAGPAGVP